MAWQQGAVRVIVVQMWPPALATDVAHPERTVCAVARKSGQWLLLGVGLPEVSDLDAVLDLIDQPTAVGYEATDSYVDRLAEVCHPTDRLSPSWLWAGLLSDGRLLVERADGHVVALDDLDLRLLDALDDELEAREVARRTLAGQSSELSEHLLMLRLGQLRSARRFLTSARAPRARTSQRPERVRTVEPVETSQ